jgi:dTDP-4-amino-4,6-dideoxygalactose transaminase
MPPLEEYTHYLEQIWSSGYLSNQGPLLKDFESQVEQYLGVDNFHFVTNGTLALQVALKALDITEGEVITTPFSFVATTSSILWERCDPIFVDIEPGTLCIDANKIEAAITDKTKAIMAVHVFGYPCDVEKIESIAKKHDLKVIYDGAHAFGAEYKGKSLLSYGDITTCSFHATKLFHTIEGGAIVVKDKAVSEKVDLIKKFGNVGDEQQMLGINAKASEFQAAMGLCNLKYIDEVIQKRSEVYHLYTELLGDSVQIPHMPEGIKYNYSYYPVIFKSEEQLLQKMKRLNEADIYPRRYFYPSLNNLSYLTKTQKCQISEDISSRIACLPLYVGLDEEVIRKIAEIINED